MNSLSDIIRRIGSSDYKSREVGHFIFNARAESFLSKFPRLFAGRHQYFEVVQSRSGTPSVTGELGPIGVMDQESGALLHIAIGYDAWILPRNVEDLIRSLVGRMQRHEGERGSGEKLDPGQELVAIVVDIVRRRVGTDIDAFTCDLVERVNAMTREIERQILRECGLSLVMTLRLADLPRDIKLPPMDFEVPVRLADFGQELTLRALLVTVVRKQDQVRATNAIKRNPQLAEAMVTSFTEFFYDVTLERFRRDLHGSLRDELIRRGARELSSWYLVLRNLNISCDDVEPPDFADLETGFAIKIRGYPRDIHIYSHVQLQRVNEAVYHRSGAPALQAWVDENVASIVKRTLFEVRYSELCVDFTPWEGRILQALQETAEQIGYRVRAQITTPDLPETEFLSQFSLQASAEFATAIDIVSSRLELVVQLRLANLRSVARDLDRGVDLKEKFETVVLQEVEAHLHTVQPAFLFTRFTRACDRSGQVLSGDVDEPLSLVEELRGRVGEALGKYGLEVLSFTVKQGSSEIRDCYLALIRAPQLEFQLPVHLRGHGAPVAYRGAVRVTGVDPAGWDRFQNALPSIDTATMYAQGLIKTVIGHAQAANGLGMSDAEARRIAERALPQEMRRLHGLSVELVSWHRERSTAENELDTVQASVIRSSLIYEAERHNEVRSQVAELKKRAFRHASFGEHDQAARVNDQIKELEVQLTERSGTGVVVLPWRNRSADGGAGTSPDDGPNPE